MQRDSEPVERGTVQAIASQLRQLIEIGGEPFDRDIDFVNRDRLQYGITKVGIDIDVDTGVFRCVVTRQTTDGEFAHQDWYRVTPANQLYYEEVVIPFEYDERTVLAAHSEALENWQKLVKQLQQTDKLNDIDEYAAMGSILSEYISMRADFYWWAQNVHDDTAPGADQIRQEELDFLQYRHREVVNRHLHSVHVVLGSEDFSDYKIKFEAVLRSFTRQLGVMDAAESRLAEASMEVNERFDLGASDHASPEQAWQLLAQLDACGDYTS